MLAEEQEGLLAYEVGVEPVGSVVVAAAVVDDILGKRRQFFS